MRALSILLALVLISCGPKPTPPIQHETVIPVSTPDPTPSPTATPRSQSGNSMQLARWQQAQYRPEKIISLDKAVFLFLQNQARYEQISKERTNGVPAVVIFVLHGRESSWSYVCHLHNGDSLMQRTFHVPKGRLPNINPPYTFEQSATDALYDYEGMNKWDWIPLGDVLQNIEKFNGLGYQKYHADVPSPYVWAATTIYSRGKYTADGRFDPLAIDSQLGCAAILKRMEERGIVLPFK